MYNPDGPCSTVYVLNVTAELADMIGVVTLHPASANAFSLLSSSVVIWMAADSGRLPWVSFA